MSTGSVMPFAASAPVLLIRPRTTWVLLVERLPKPHAAAHELRPMGNWRHRIGRLRKEAPELRVVPAEVVSRGVAMASDAGTELFDLLD